MDVKALIDKAVEIMVSEAALARALHVSPSNVNDWRHERKPCADKHVVAMAKIIGKDPRTVAAEVYLARLGKLALISLAGVAVTIAGWLVPGGAANAAPATDDNVYYVNSGIDRASRSAPSNGRRQPTCVPSRTALEDRSVPTGVLGTE